MDKVEQWRKWRRRGEKQALRSRVHLGHPARTSPHCSNLPPSMMGTALCTGLRRGTGRLGLEPGDLEMLQPRRHLFMRALFHNGAPPAISSYATVRFTRGKGIGFLKGAQANRWSRDAFCPAVVWLRGGRPCWWGFATIRGRVQQSRGSCRGLWRRNGRGRHGRWRQRCGCPVLWLGPHGRVQQQLFLVRSYPSILDRGCWRGRARDCRMKVNCQKSCGTIGCGVEDAAPDDLADNPACMTALDVAGSAFGLVSAGLGQGRRRPQAAAGRRTSWRPTGAPSPSPPSWSPCPPSPRPSRPPRRRPSTPSPRPPSLPSSIPSPRPRPSRKRRRSSPSPSRTRPLSYPRTRAFQGRRGTLQGGR